MIRCKINSKKTQSKYNLNQEYVFLHLISGVGRGCYGKLIVEESGWLLEANSEDAEKISAIGSCRLFRTYQDLPGWVPREVPGEVGDFRKVLAHYRREFRGSLAAASAMSGADIAERRRRMRPLATD